MSMKSVVTRSLAIAALTTAATGIAADDAHAADDKEKCYGVVEAGQNDCGDASGDHSCQGQATKDAAGDEWVYVPKGLCDKLAGGSTEPKES